MSSQKQIEANRRNALKSTGPKSDGCKARSRLNALRHGLTAAQAVLPHEDEKDYEKLREGMLESYAPENSAEQAIVEELANAYWRLLRMHRVENQYWDHLGGCYNRGDAGIAEALLHAPDKQTRNYFRYYAQVERSYYKALAAADQIKRERRNRKPLKTMVAAGQNGFVSQNAEEAETAVAQAPETAQDGIVSQRPAEAVSHTCPGAPVPRAA